MFCQTFIWRSCADSVYCAIHHILRTVCSTKRIWKNVVFSTQENIISNKFVYWLLIWNIHIFLHDLKLRLYKILTCTEKYSKNKTLKDQSANILINREVRKGNYVLISSSYKRVPQKNSSKLLHYYNKWSKFTGSKITI